MKALNLGQVKEELAAARVKTEQLIKEGRWREAFDSVVDECYLERLAKAMEKPAVTMEEREGLWQSSLNFS